MNPSTTISGSETGSELPALVAERDVVDDRMMLRYENNTARIAGATRAVSVMRVCLRELCGS